MKSDYLCRCCLSETCFKDISNEYVYGDQKEVYADMLLNTFNINISFQESSMRLICEDCIVRLRDAAAFKKQVERVEEAIVSNIYNTVCKATEPSNPKLNHEDDFLDYITGEFDEDDYNDNHSNDDYAGDDLIDNGVEWQDPVVKHGDNEGNNVLRLETTDNLDDLPLLFRMKKFTKKKNTKSKKTPTKTSTDKKEPQTENPQLLRKNNSLTLVTNSNICLFDSLKTKFGCFYCKNSYLNISELREHSLTHTINLNYLKNRFRMSYKNAEISDLKCKICSENLQDLNLLREHLISEHNIQFAGEEHMLIPYRLKDGCNCFLCDDKFNTFFKLSGHMNSHYTNHVCEVCGKSFINRMGLRLHVQRHREMMKCSTCDAVFPSLYLRIKHMRKVHNSALPKRYCLLCNKTFRYTYLLNEHKVQEHGAKRKVLSCEECGKTFAATVNLRTHTRSVHMKERTHACTHCGMGFFTSCDRRRHENTHHDHRSFACNFCESRFKSKDSLRRHLKRQHGNIFSNPTNTMQC